MYDDPVEPSYGSGGTGTPENTRLKTYLAGLGSLAGTYQDELNRQDFQSTGGHPDLVAYPQTAGPQAGSFPPDKSGLERLNSLFSMPASSYGEDRPLPGTGRVVSSTGNVNNPFSPLQQTAGLPAGRPPGSSPARSASPAQPGNGPQNDPDREDLSPEMYGRSRMMVPYGVNSKKKIDNISKNLPWILHELKAKGISDPDMIRYALATLNAENDTFESRSEGEDDDRPNANPKKAHRGNSTAQDTPGHRPFDHYDNRSDLGNNQPGDGERFKGRGFVQLTGRANYKHMQEKLGIPLLEHPELADDPKIAAKIFAQYLLDHEPGIRTALKGNNLTDARVVVNGRNKNTHLPNGLYAFKTAYDFGLRHENLAKTIASQPNLTVSDIARIWTEGSTPQQADAYLQTTSKLLGVTPGTRFADLTDSQKKQLEDTQVQYVRSVLGDKTMSASFMAKAKAEALQQFLAREAAKKQAAAAKRQAHPPGKAHKRDQPQIQPRPQILP